MIKEKKIQYDKFGYRIDNFDEFVSKKYYIKPDDEEKLDKTLQSIEDHMKTFKYYEDLPEY